MKTLLLLALLTFASALPAQVASPSAADTSFFRPQRTVFFSPLALVNLHAGSGVRFGMEYRLAENLNGLTELTLYIPASRNYESVHGFRLRQDFRVYNMKKQLFIGGSIMLKQQTLGDIAVIPVTDSTVYRKAYNVQKTVVSPSIVIGFNGMEYRHIYFEACVYVGVRFKNAAHVGLTPTESTRMHSYNRRPEDLPIQFALKKGMSVAPELQPCLRVGYKF
jgi:hypothetical protein